MKELLKELGFERLPMLSEFVKAIENMPTEYVTDSHIFRERYMRIWDYRNFITQPLTKGMFIPCDEEGNVLEKPLPASFETSQQYRHLQMLYQQAKDRVLFELPNPFKANRKDENIKYFFDKYKTIEQAINNGVVLTLKQ